MKKRNEEIYNRVKYILEKKANRGMCACVCVCVDTVKSTV